MRRFATCCCCFVMMFYVARTLIAAAPINSDNRALLPRNAGNLRTLGGMPVSGGFLRQGMLFRSAYLGNLGPRELLVVRALGLRTVIDLRQWLEVVFGGADQRWMAAGSGYRLALPMASAVFPTASYYCRMLKTQGGRDSVRKFFKTLEDPASYPVLIHCAHGKDRTGTMTALLLMALGTPHDAIMEDFLASPHVHARWLEGMFGAVARSGGIEPFLAQYGIGPADLQAVRANLVAPTATAFVKSASAGAHLQP